MFVHVGSKFTAASSGTALRTVKCEHCSCEYLYVIARNATGHAFSLFWLDNQGAKGRARKTAAQTVEEQLRNAVEPIPCPDCGWLQSSMVTMLRWRWVGHVTAAAVMVLVGALILAGAWNQDPWYWAAIVGGLYITGLIFVKKHNHNKNPGGRAESTVGPSSRAIRKAEFLRQQDAASGAAGANPSDSMDHAQQSEDIENLTPPRELL